MNREQGGAAHITKNGIRFHSLFTLSQLLNILKNAGKIDDKLVKAVGTYIAESQVPNNVTKPVPIRTTLPYEARIELAKCPIAKELLTKMCTKKTNLCLAADATKTIDILNIAEVTGPYICLLKTHVDIIDDFSQDFIKSLTALAKKHDFLIMEDRKFADIGNTVSLQYSSGIFQISNWAQLVTVHSLTGPSIIQGLKNSLAGLSESRGVFLLAEISSAGNLITPQYTESTSKLAVADVDADFVAGIVCQNPNVVPNAGLLQLTPGCKIDTNSDGLGQQYNTPEYVIKEKGADIAVVGRGILSAKDPQAAAKLYRDHLWTAYCERVGIPNEI